MTPLQLLGLSFIAVGIFFIGVGWSYSLTNNNYLGRMHSAKMIRDWISKRRTNRKVLEKKSE